MMKKKNFHQKADLSGFGTELFNFKWSNYIFINSDGVIACIQWNNNNYTLFFDTPVWIVRLSVLNSNLLLCNYTVALITTNTAYRSPIFSVFNYPFPSLSIYYSNRNISLCLTTAFQWSYNLLQVFIAQFSFSRASLEMSLFDRIDFTGWRLSGFFGLCDLCVVYFVDSNSKL